MNRLSKAYNDIHRLAARDQIGAVVLAEQAIDDHVALFPRPDDKLAALHALSRDFIELAKAEPQVANFLRKAQDYIDFLCRQHEP